MRGVALLQHPPQQQGGGSLIPQLQHCHRVSRQQALASCAEASALLQCALAGGERGRHKELQAGGWVAGSQVGGQAAGRGDQGGKRAGRRWSSSQASMQAADALERRKGLAERKATRHSSTECTACVPSVVCRHISHFRTHLLALWQLGDAGVGTRGAHVPPVAHLTSVLSNMNLRQGRAGKDREEANRSRGRLPRLCTQQLAWVDLACSRTWQHVWVWLWGSAPGGRPVDEERPAPTRGGVTCTAAMTPGLWVAGWLSVCLAGCLAS